LAEKYNLTGQIAYKKANLSYSAQHLGLIVQGVRIDESDSPDGKKRLSVSHNQPGIGLFEISMICNICKQTEGITLSLNYAWALTAMETAIAVVIRTKTGKTYHLIFILTAATIMPVLYRFLTMLVMIMFTSRVAVVVMDVVTRMGSERHMDKRITGFTACVYIKTYDTQAVPYHKQNRRYFHQYAFHFNLQI
jgi:hypothetical protein